MTRLIEITGKALSGEWGTDDTNGNAFLFYEQLILRMKELWIMKW